MTFEVRSGGGGYEPYFETLWDLRGQYAPVFDAIVGSIEVTVPGPSLSFSLDGPGQFPHDAPGLEARMPQEALGRPLCTWSVHGAAIWSLFGSDARAEAEGILKDLSLTEGDLTLAVAGRSNLDDPPFIVIASEYAGAKPDDLLVGVAGWSGTTRQVGAKLVFVIDGPDTSHAEGLDYYYPTGNVIYQIKTADEQWFEDVLRQLP